eukprot:g29480.t1
MADFHRLESSSAAQPMIRRNLLLSIMATFGGLSLWSARRGLGRAFSAFSSPTPPPNTPFFPRQGLESVLATPNPQPHNQFGTSRHPKLDPQDMYYPEGFASNYTPLLNRKQIQLAVHKAKLFFEQEFSKDLNLFKHVSPLVFPSNLGINDDLDGSARHAPIQFHVENIRTDRGVVVDESKLKKSKFAFDAEVVESLAKWKRQLLQWYGCEVHEGLFCDSFSIRKGYFADDTHSIVCDQWDWELRITAKDRTQQYLKETVRKIYRVIKRTEDMLIKEFPTLAKVNRLPDDIHFIRADDLHQMFPGAGVHEREDLGAQRFGAMFVMEMGWPMADGSAPEEVRAPDYDDWRLNGDIIVLHPITRKRHELSSMGIRVDKKSLQEQLKARGMEDRLRLPFHQLLMQDRIPLSMGGGIGISRLMMLLLRTGHIGEVQAGAWHPQHVRQAADANMQLIPAVLPL